LVTPKTEPWFAVQVIPRHEQKIALHLRNKGHEQFLPFCSSFRRWSDRDKNVNVPLFPGYLFCRVARSSFGSVLKTPGVYRIVCFGGHPYPVSDEEIQGLQLAVESGVPVSPVPYLSLGEKVQIKHGPLAGVTGIVTRFKNRARLVISVDVIMQSVSLEIPQCDAIPVGSPFGVKAPGARSPSEASNWANGGG
jgi:transcription antitermination factor NusG